MNVETLSSVTYDASQLALLLEELREIRADRDRIWEEKNAEIDTLYAEIEKRDKRLEVKDTLLQMAEEENRKLKERDAFVRATAAIPSTVHGPYAKLAMITKQQQVTYSAGKHGGDESVQLTSMKRWNMAIGGNEENTHCIARALDALESTGTITRTKVDCPDKRKHFSVQVNEEHFRNPKLIKSTEERPNNGGNKRCPNPECGGICKKRVNVTYECEKCGIEFDGAMNPLGTPVKDALLPMNAGLIWDVETGKWQKPLTEENGTRSQPAPAVPTVSQPVPAPINWNAPDEDLPVEEVLTEDDITRAFGPKRVVDGKNECITCIERAATSNAQHVPPYPHPDRDCFICQTNNWCVQDTLGELSWACGTCHPEVQSW